MSGVRGSETVAYFILSLGTHTPPPYHVPAGFVRFQNPEVTSEHGATRIISA